MADPILRIGAKYDGSDVKRGAAETKADIKDIGDAAKSSFGTAGQAVNAFGETLDQANARYKSLAKTAIESAQALSTENAARSASLGVIASETSAITANTTAKVANSAAVTAMSQSASSFIQLSKDAQAAMNAEATTVADITAKRTLYSQALKSGAIDQAEYSTALKGLAIDEAAVQKAQAASAVTAQKLFQTYGGSAAQIEKLATDEAKLTALFAQGAISGEQYIKSLSGIANARTALQTATKDVNGLSSALGNLNFTSAQVTRDYGLLAKDLATGQFSLAEREVSTLASRTGLLQLAFSATGAAIGGVLLVVASFIGLFISAENEIDQFNKSIALTGNFTVATAQGMATIVTNVGQVTGKFGDAQTAVVSFTSKGVIGFENLETATQGAVELAELSGQKIEEAVKSFDKIGQDPVKGIETLNASLHFLTDSQDTYIRQLVEEGNKTEAVTVATGLATAALNDRMAEYKSNQGIISKGWDNIKTSIEGSINSAKTFFQTISANPLQKVSDFFSNLGTSAFVGGQSGRVGAPDALAQGAGTQEVTDALNQQNAALKANKQAADDYLNSLKDGNDKTLKSLEQTVSTFGQGREALEKYITSQLLAKVTTAQYGDQVDRVKEAIIAQRSPIEQLAANYDDLNAKQQTHITSDKLAEQQSKALAKTLADQAKATASMDQIQVDADAELGGAGSAAVKAYEASMKLLNAAYGVFLEQGPPTLALQDKYTKAATTLLNVEKEKQATDEHNHDYAALALEDLDKQIAAQQAYGTVAQTLLVVEKAYQQSVKDGHPLNQQELQDLYNKAAADEQQLAQLKQLHDAINTFADAEGQLISGVSTDFANFIDGATKGWKGFGQALVQTAQQFIGAIIAEFVKLAIFSAITGQSFNFTSLLGAGLSAGLGGGGLLGGGGSALIGGSSIATGGAASVGGITSGGVASIFDPTTWISAGQKMFQGFQTGFSNIGNTFGNASAHLFGTSTYTADGFLGPPSDLANDFVGPSSTLAGPGGLVNGGYGSSLGQGLGIAGGVIAGVNEFNTAGGGAAGLAGGLSYGAGTYLAGAAITATLSGGLTAGVAALGALGPIGWVALAAMAVNMISGGKLFGTAATKFVSAQSGLTIGADGATIDNSETLKGQKALFGGSYTKTKGLSVDPAAQAAADAFYQAILDQRTSFAQEFNATVGQVVGGSFVTTFDKNGKATGTTTTINGQTYTGETQDQFSERVQAANIADFLNKLGVNTDAFLAGAEKDADTLLQKAQDLASASVEAQKDITGGFDLITGGSLADVVNLTIQLNGANENLADTYVRLKSELAALNSNVDIATIALGKTGTDMVKFADDAAAAAGGAQALAQLVQTFNQDFYDSGAVSANQISTLKQTLAGQGAAIGEDPNESAAKFKADFEAALPTLTAAQLVQWQQFGVNLIATQQAVADAGTAYTQFIQSFGGTVQVVSAFETALNSLGDTLKGNIQQANDLATAAGKAGASEDDIRTVVQGTLNNAIATFQQLLSDTQKLADSVFGGDAISRLQAKIAQTENIGIIDFTDRAQLTALQNGTSQAAQAQSATQLLGNFGQIGAITGQSLDSLLSEFGGSDTQLGQILGLNNDQLVAAYNQQVATAKAALATADNTQYANELLADLVATAQGVAQPYSIDQILAAFNSANDTSATGSSASSGKLGTPTVTGGIAPTYVPANAGTATAVGPGGTPGTQPVTPAPTTQDASAAAIVEIPDSLKDNTAALLAGLGPIAVQLTAISNTLAKRGFQIAGR